jgi:hypothetical protein
MIRLQLRAIMTSAASKGISATGAALLAFIISGGIVPSVQAVAPAPAIRQAPMAAPQPPPGGRIYGPFGTKQADPSGVQCQRVLRKVVVPAGWKKACFVGDDGNWYIAVWAPQEQNQNVQFFDPGNYLISLSVQIVMQNDGNLVVYDNLSRRALWASNTVNRGAFATS